MFHIPLTHYPIVFFNDTATTEIYTLSLHDALPIWHIPLAGLWRDAARHPADRREWNDVRAVGHDSVFQVTPRLSACDASAYARARWRDRGARRCRSRAIGRGGIGCEL